MSGPSRSIFRIAAVPLLLATGWTQASAAETAKSDENVDIAALARSIELDPKLSRCTVSKERTGKGLENLLTVLKDGKPPAVARAVYRWKQQRIAGETNKTPKFIFGSKSGSDKDAKLAIMSDEYDSVSWGPAFDDKGGKALYETLGKAVENKDDAALEGKLDSMLTGLREALEVTGKDELISWGEKFSLQDLAAVAQQVIATQEPQEAEITDGVKLEVGMQTYTTRQLYAYMHPVYDPDKNALSCDKLEDSLPVSTEYQLYVALTGIQEGESAELAEATEAVPGQEEAQGDADLAGHAIDNEVELAEGPQGEPADERDVAARDAAGEPGGEEVATVEEGGNGAREEGASEVVEVDEKSYDSEPRRRPKKRYRAPKEDDYYVEEPVETIDYDPVEVVDDVEDYVDDWYDYPGYYDDYGYTEVYIEPLPPPIFIRPPIIVTPVISLFGGAVVFAAVTQPRWQRPWWNRPVAFARNRPNNTTININFIKPNRPKAFKPGWGLKQNRGFVQRKPKVLAGKARLIPAKATLGGKRKPGGLAGKPGLFKPKNANANANRIRNGRAAKKALAARNAAKKFGPKGPNAGKNKAAIAKRKAAAKRAVLAKKNAALAKQKAGKNGAAAKNAAAKAKAARAKAALAKKRAAAKKLAAKKTGNKKDQAAKNAAAKKQAARKAALAKQKASAQQKAAAGKKKAAQNAAAARQKAAAAQQKAAAAKKAAAARQAAAKQKAAAGKRKAAANQAAAAKRAAQAKQNAAAKAAAARNNAQAKLRAQQQAKQRAQQQAKQRANHQAKQRAQQQAKQRANQQARQQAQQRAKQQAQQRAKQQANANKGPRPCPPGKRRVPGKGCV